MQDHNEQDKKQLIERYIDGKATEKELMVFFGLIHRRELDDLLMQFLDADFETARLAAYGTQVRKKSGRWWVAAASIFLVFSIGGYFLLHKQAPQQIAQNGQHDIAPGHNQATLTLAGGQKIILTKALSGKLAQQGNMLVQVNNASAITYTASGITADVPVQYNTMSTGRGEMSPYPLVLADGTKIWLDAASSVTFPTAFKGGERRVSITGQAYFEVVHNDARPFRVSVNGVTIEDIGTKFVVNGYTDEPGTKTTLVEGAVKVIAGDVNAVTLKPGQAALFRPGAEKIKVSEANIEAALAWKNDYFRFHDDHIDNIMRQLARWYNIDVSFEGSVSQEEYNGRISRFKNISQVLDMLSTTNTVHFKVEGRRVTVMR